LVLALVIGLLAAGCDSLESPLGDENRLVIESFQEVGQPLGSVRFSRIAEINAAYDPDTQGISGADVQVHLLASDGSREQTIEYRDSPDVAGVYEPVNPPTVLELRTYELEVSHPDAPQTITSTTVTPGSFEIVRPGLPEVVYQEEPQFVVGVSRSEYPDRQSIFVFSVESLEPTIDNLTPLYYEFVDPLDPSNDGLTEEEILEDVLIVESPPVNEANYDFQADNSIDVKLPWLAVAFYGPTRTYISAIDENLYDFIRSQDVQQGGSTLSPGEIPNVINRIDGATGVFGSFARVSQETNIIEP
jgi:hypothetical protein